MSDSSATQLKSETEIKRRQESSFLEALVPIPDFFFNIKAEIEPIGGSAWVIRMLAYLLYFLTLCVMFGSFTYYSLPAQRLSLEVPGHLGMAKDRLRVQAPPEDHFARSEHGLELR